MLLKQQNFVAAWKWGQRQICRRRLTQTQTDHLCLLHWAEITAPLSQRSVMWAMLRAAALFPSFALVNTAVPHFTTQ